METEILRLSLNTGSDLTLLPQLGRQDLGLYIYFSNRMLSVEVETPTEL